MWYLYTGEYYSTIKNDEIMLLWMDVQIIILSEVQSERKNKYYMTSHIVEYF